MVVVLCAAAALAASCGMRPPREYHEISKTENVDLSPMPAPVHDADAGAGEEVDASPDGPGMGSLSIALPWAAVPAMPIAQLLGKSRKDVEALQAPVKPVTHEEKVAARKEAKEGWTRYTANLRIRFDDADIAVAIEQQVPATLSCLDAAKWLGFAEAEPPVDGKERCTWTAEAGDNSLGGGASGELDRKSAMFKAFRPAPKTP
jgi:hypothetical protein